MLERKTFWIFESLLVFCTPENRKQTTTKVIGEWGGNYSYQYGDTQSTFLSSGVNENVNLYLMGILPKALPQGIIAAIISPWTELIKPFSKYLGSYACFNKSVLQFHAWTKRSRIPIRIFKCIFPTLTSNVKSSNGNSPTFILKTKKQVSD